jgi:hypothetical protein
MLSQPHAAEAFADEVRRVPTLVVVDEIHHAAEDRSYGIALRTLSEPAQRRLMLTGTLFRTSKKERIAFAEFDSNNTIVADYTYTYTQAINDGHCRGLIAYSYDGKAHWIDAAGERHDECLTADLDEADEGAAYHTLLKPGPWVKGFLECADEFLDEQRFEDPRAGGLVLASCKEDAKAYAKILNDLTGEKPTLVTEDVPDAVHRIDRFRKGHTRWMVAVQMISEGVDIPRLSVLCYLTTKKTTLHFIQAVGRTLRKDGPVEDAILLIPAHSRLVTLASELLQVSEEAHTLLIKEEKERNQDLQESECSPSPSSFTPLGADGLDLDSAMTLYGKFDPDDIRDIEEHLMRHGRPKKLAPIIAEWMSESPPTTRTPDRTPETPSLVQQIAGMRRDKDKLANRVANKWNVPYKELHTAVAKHVGSWTRESSLPELAKAVRFLEMWLRDGEPPT